ncbi:MAG: hypothetical protein QM733_00200 [Ilumatobacteraceae bacterium]
MKSTSWWGCFTSISGRLAGEAGRAARRRPPAGGGLLYVEVPTLADRATVIDPDCSDLDVHLDAELPDTPRIAREDAS